MATLSSKRIRRILDDAFSGLSRRQLDRFAHHLEAGTRILCGREATLFCHGDGGG